MLLPLVLAITLSLSAASPVFANHFGEDDGGSSTPYSAYGYNPYGSGNLEPQRETWRREAFQAEQRNREAVERRNQPTEYQNSRDYNSTEHFSLWNGTDQKACTATKYDVSCW